MANSNGLAWSPDGHTMYWTDTKLSTVFAFDFDPQAGNLSRRRVFASFPPKQDGGRWTTYGGRPDGGAVDSEGCYWAACFEGQRLARFAPDGDLLQSVALPVRCPTMPCFGGDDLRTLYVTTSREKRPEAELAAQPWAGPGAAVPRRRAGAAGQLRGRLSRRRSQRAISAAELPIRGLRCRRTTLRERHERATNAHGGRAHTGAPRSTRAQRHSRRRRCS